jgi:hypothetical protein
VRVWQCPLAGADRKWRFGAAKTAFDPNRKSDLKSKLTNREGSANGWGLCPVLLPGHRVANDHAPVRSNDSLLAVNELAMYFPTRRTNHDYLQFLVVAQALVAGMLCKFFAVFNRFQIGIEVNTDAISHRNAVFHIKEKIAI